MSWRDEKYMARTVIDANVVISAPFGGMPLEAAARAMSRHQVYVSEEIEQELLSVVARLGKKLAEEQRVVYDGKNSATDRARDACCRVNSRCLVKGRKRRSLSLTV